MRWAALPSNEPSSEWDVHNREDLASSYSYGLRIGTSTAKDATLRSCIRHVAHTPRTLNLPSLNYLAGLAIAPKHQV